MELEQSRSRGDALLQDDMDEVQQYREKVTKWIAGSLLCLNDLTFWFILKCSNVTRAPLTRLFAMMSKDRPEGLSKGACVAEEIPVVKLICTRCPQVNQMFLDMCLTFDQWFGDTLYFASRALYHDRQEQCEISEDYMRFLKCIAWDLLMHNFTAFHRRFVQPLSQHLDVSKPTCSSHECIKVF